MNIDKAIELALENVYKEGLTDIFPTPFELSLLKKNEHFRSFLTDQIKKRINSSTLSGLKVHPIGHVLFPKKDAYDFRRAALIQPIDTIVYLALVLLYADVIEKNRIEKRHKVIFSYRLKPKGGYLFDPKFNYTSFQAHVAERQKNRKIKVLVKCDISSFYDRLNLHRLESTLLSLPIDNKLVKLTNELLLFWANRDSYSLPIGGNASRILAEAALISVDDYLRSLNVQFCRFVDDYRFFAPDAKTAHAWLTIFVERLYLEGLTVNPAKTAIEDVSKKSKSSTIVSEEARKVANELRQGRIIVGYSGTIPTKFRELSEREIAELKEAATEELEEQITRSQILQPDDVRRFLRIVVASGDYSKLALYQSLIEKFPQFTPLFIDLLIKKEPLIPDTLKKSITAYFSGALFEGAKYPEYMLISIVRLLGKKGFSNTGALMELFRSLSRNSGAYVGRAVLDALSGNTTRTDVLEIRQYYPRADLWEKRAIIRLVDSTLSEEEKRPWLKNVKVHSFEDYFAIESFDPKKVNK
ncbi:RNA-directed DNA polymerase [Acidithiobacillus ferriphilus]|uniref:RNA-directed DNA polymerase n=1 Tax=Acidithiobacillus ferriphilus TaxID=1689834 RepID=UPI002DB9509B|nr:RNA-directed DNA polymerase [Acidithiobacillus ferriphilus]MEB8476318.1 RNA-directed DNA polymerase [Acidithiobacillus ferriphilus]